ncbi:MAG: tryptophan 7-halogenase [Deltaproteobacteria bacterium]|nr:tryptophan 7-halogenase [Nannocystaceae bacterium]
MSEIDVLVVGGGPSGSTAAAKLARAGLRVVLLEAGTHPRAHVGESLLPGIIPILGDIGVLPAIEAAGFAHKSGSTLWHWGRTPAWDLWFADSDAYDHAWLVERARFDALLFEHARSCGAEVHERARVDALLWEHGRVVGAAWHRRDDAAPEQLRARWVIDASGQSALQGRALALREPIDGFRHQAMWAHFEGVTRLPAPRAEQALFIAQPEQWWWMFPLADGRTSIGVVQLDATHHHGPVRPDFDGELARCPELAALVQPHGRRVSEVRNERDWSYRMREVAGPGWLASGDAAGFIDPVLSTGVMLALHSGWHAARTILEIGGSGDESGALGRYREHYAAMFGDLLRMVRFYYQQNLHREDYFWESKRILLQQATELRPQKAFVVLTSGLVQNLALGDLHTRGHARREQLAERGNPAIDCSEPERLGFVCLHLRHDDGVADTDGPDRGTSIYVVVEPAAPAEPTLFRTRNFHVNAIAPRHGNDPISVPRLAGPLRTVASWITALDVVDDEPLAAFWTRTRAELAQRFAAGPDALAGFTLVRAFGE